MTCCVALETPDGVVLGTDSFYGNEDFRGKVDQPKWILREQYAIAYAGPLRSAQVLASKLRMTPRKGNEGSREYAQRIADKIKALLDRDSEEEPELLVVVGDKAFIVNSGYAVARSLNGFEAIGSGHMVALAALHAIDKTQDGEAIVHQVLQIASDVCSSVCGPFHVRTL